MHVHSAMQKWLNHYRIGMTNNTELIGDHDHQKQVT